MNGNMGGFLVRAARARGVRVLMLAAPLTLSLSACEWFSDFKRQPSIWTWEPVCHDSKSEETMVCDTAVPSRGNPQYSVSIYGTARSGLETSYQSSPIVIDSMSNIPNPTPVSEVSLANGHKYYQINCAVCHGDKGIGDGLATKYGMVGVPPLALGDAKDKRSDGYIFGIIRNGRGLMPPYNRIEEMDRWDVVNYIRALQGKTAMAASTGEIARPGVTGRWVPGYTVMAPTREAPFVPPAQGSAKNYYTNGGAPPALDMNASRVGAPLPDSTLYKNGNVAGTTDNAGEGSH